MHPISEWEQGVYDLGAFKLDHLESLRPLFENTFPHYIPWFKVSHMQQFPSKHAEKRVLQKDQNWITPRGIWPSGIQIGQLECMKFILEIK